MKNNKVIGCIKDGYRDELLYISPSIPNKHMEVSGVSGMGKTTFLNSQIYGFCKENIPVLILNHLNSFQYSQMPPKYRSWYKKNTQTFAVKTGIPMSLFSYSNTSIGLEGNTEYIVETASDCLADAADLPVTERRALYEAVSHVFETGAYEKEGIRSIGTALEDMESQRAMNAFQKLHSIFNMNIFKPGDRDIAYMAKPITEINLDGLSGVSQILASKIILNYIWAHAVSGRFLEKGLAIILDEAHHFTFSHKAKGPIYSILTEGRRRNLSVVLSSSEPMISNSKMSAARQCGIKVFFKPADNARRLAGEIYPTKRDKWTMTLNQLDKGEFICIGDIVTESGSRVSTPRVLKTYLPDNYQDDLSDPSTGEEGDTNDGN